MPSAQEIKYLISANDWYNIKVKHFTLLDFFNNQTHHRCKECKIHRKKRGFFVGLVHNFQLAKTGLSGEATTAKLDRCPTTTNGKHKKRVLRSLEKRREEA